MIERLKANFIKIVDYWKSRTKKQKTISISLFLFLFLLIGGFTYFSTRTTMVPLYSNLKPDEAGQIKQTLDSQGTKSLLTDGGQTIEVPEQDVNALKVQLAANGIPKSGSIDYSFFSQNASFGMTDNQFNVLKLDAMQTELSNLIEQIDGVSQAKVMINMPDKGVFVNDQTQQASASIVLTLKPGVDLDQKQINSLYHLVSKSVPNLPTDNIVIMNQNFEYYDLNNSDNSVSNEFTQQMNARHEIERDIQRQVQSMLGTMMGYDKVVASVTADIDFTQEKQDENIVTPVDQKNMKGIAVSAQKITETFTGNGSAAAGGVPTSGSSTDTTTSSYVSGGNNSNGNYEKIQDTVNYDVNKIHRQIVESPYKIRDLGIQVMVEPPNPKDPQSLPASRVNDIKNILSTIVSTSIDKSEGTNLSNSAVQSKIAVSVEPFNGKLTTSTSTSSGIPWWIYAVGGGLLLIIGLLVFFLLRSRRKTNLEDYDLEQVVDRETFNIPDINIEQETETTMRKKQLERMAKEKPDEFAKLLRTWISEE
ncbi:flagellar basal-body MS-ring/collar protein FliF [Heyndrickxia acidicola]|uniref:Flagellar M-ring protein n=1 Tax=Heyndrickxia acidicola TaxID=209389 RepID=A0ABU6MBM2_9BACI|nr:flagellar basal-body MS-ring/collar protein FliF [Heyndrickxia acidicola]MED1202077.1 flagellar basal-body MS-ring/collar protein FliF [Heyndrickxia acidicola]